MTADDATLDREALVGVLQAHRALRLGDGVFCTCGRWSVGRGSGADDAHAEHQAAALAPLVARVEAQDRCPKCAAEDATRSAKAAAWDEGFRARATWQSFQTFTAPAEPRPVNPYRRDRR